MIGGSDVYQSAADVTALVAGAGGGSWEALGAQFVAGAGTNAGAYAGWALVVVLEDPTLPPARVAVFDGLALVDGSTAAEFDVAVAPGAAATLGVVAWEGDANTNGDALQVGGIAVEPATGLHAVDNAFDSTADGFGEANSFGVDVKRFLPRSMSTPRATLTATTAGDIYLIGAVTVESR